MGCGVLAQAVSNTTVSHNDIRHFAYTGISLGWTWNYVPTSNGNNEVSLCPTLRNLLSLTSLVCIALDSYRSTTSQKLVLDSSVIWDAFITWVRTLEQKFRITSATTSKASDTEGTVSLTVD